MTSDTPVPPRGGAGEAAAGPTARGSAAAQDPVALVADFVHAARLMRLGRAADAWVVLLPRQLDKAELRQRVHTMVAVAAVVTGALTAPGEPCVYRPVASAPMEALAGELSRAGAALDAVAVRDLIAAQCAATEGVDHALVDVLHVLAARFAVLSAREPVPDLRPAAGRAAAPSTAPGGRPVPPEEEVEQLAQLLAEVVHLAEAGAAWWPSRLEVLANDARQQPRVQLALDELHATLASPITPWGR